MTEPFFYHERIARGADTLARLRDLPITVCGAGAVGANLTESLARVGCARLKVIDRDRVEERNLSTQPWQRGDVGAQKARILGNTLFRALRVEVVAVVDELSSGNVARLLAGSGLVVDAFDNSAARRAVHEHCAAADVPCLHVGLAADYAEVAWNEVYRVPSDAQDDVCDYPLTRSLVLLAVAVASEAVVAFAARGERVSRAITLNDLAIGSY
ncbi:MAG: ThiF family adenylyltransferase [Armatimonadetes bacterium]|nr:ThiF family adenylyltransferase [Armatimonadota bacterium]